MPESYRLRRAFLMRLGFCLLLYLLAVAAYSVWSYQEHKTTLMNTVDDRLLQAARSLKYLLAPDFHDRALAPDSIAMDEELQNRKQITEFGVESGFKWVHTIVEMNGGFYFAAPSVSEEEARERVSWYFYPYEDIPGPFVQALRGTQPVFLDYTDQWGSFRSVALPQRSPGGRPYLACADIESVDLDRLLRRNLLSSLGVALFFFIAILPLMGLLISFFRAHMVQLKALNTELRGHKEHLQDLVDVRTEALRQETRRLEEALANVRTLRGLFPICAACKKIRDDQGYWKQLEEYIRMNSDAEFSHSLCPDCIRRLYPNLSSDDPLPPADPSSPA